MYCRERGEALEAERVQRVGFFYEGLLIETPGLRTPETTMRLSLRLDDARVRFPDCLHGLW